MKLIFKVLTLGLLLPMVGCMSSVMTTRVNSEVATVKGMIYDHERRQVTQATVEFYSKNKDGTWMEPKILESDINGRFSLAEIPFGAKKAIVKKAGYEPYEYEFLFQEASQILYFQIINVDQLLGLASKSLEAQEWERSKDLLLRAEKLTKPTPSLIFLKAVYENSQGRYPEAVKLIEDFRVTSAADYFPLLVYLGDLYQKRLSNSDKARESYAKALILKYDAEVKNRLDALPKAP